MASATPLTGSQTVTQTDHPETTKITLEPLLQKIQRIARQSLELGVLNGHSAAMLNEITRAESLPENTTLAKVFCIAFDQGIQSAPDLFEPLAEEWLGCLDTLSGSDEKLAALLDSCAEDIGAVEGSASGEHEVERMMREMSSELKEWQAEMKAIAEKGLERRDTHFDAVHLLTGEIEAVQDELRTLASMTQGPETVEKIKATLEAAKMTISRSRAVIEKR